MNRRDFVGTLAAGSLVAASGPSPSRAAEPAAPLRLGMAGLVHGHAGGFLGRYRADREVDLVGVSEPDAAVSSRYAGQFKLDPSKMFRSVEEMLDRARPEAVVAFTSTAGHLDVVAACAARKIPVMMEKPLATTVEAARAIEKLGEEAGIPVLVNYETTWYPSNVEAHALAESGALGEVRKVVVHDGHRGPKEIGCQPEFVDWLTDPARNGAGALFDFGCYGANLMTWLMGDARPASVSAVTRRFKPEVYPNVDDDATILLEYPGAQAILQASWNWPFDRKDMEIYGRTGQAITVGRDGLKVRQAGKAEESRRAGPIAAPADDFVRYFAAVVRGQVRPSGLSALKNNVIVVEILDAARRSAESGRKVELG